MKAINQFLPFLCIALILLSSCKKDDDDDTTTQDDLIWSFVAAWGSGGTGDGQYNLITGMEVDGNGNQYLSDINQNRVQKISSTGVFVTKWGSAGTSSGEFAWPREIAVDGIGDIWVADENNCRVQQFTSSGAYINQIGSACGGAAPVFGGLDEIEIDKDNNIYVSDYGNQQIQKFDIQGNHILSWGYNFSLGFIRALSADSNGDLFVAFVNVVDTNWTNTIAQYSSTGTLKNSWTETATNNAASTMDFDSQDNLHIGFVDGFIQIFKTDGTFIKQYGEAGTGQGQILGLDELRFGPNDDLYIAGCTGNLNCRISKFAKQ